MIFTIPYGPTDEYILSTDRLTQVDTVDNFTLILSGVVTGNRELTTEFRYKNPTTWSSYAVISVAALNAITVDSDQGLYFDYKFTRTGADTTGTIDVLRVDMQYTIDPAAV